MSQNKTFFDVDAKKDQEEEMHFVQVDEDEEPIG